MLLTPQSQNTSFFDKLNSISPTSPISKVLKTVIQAISITLIILSTQSATAINSINHTYDDQLALSKHAPLTHTNSAYNTPTPTTPESSLPILNQRHEIYSYQIPTPNKHLRHLNANFLQRTETKPSTSPTATYYITVFFLSSSVSTQPNKGLHHYKFRHYSAELGRWLGRDPIEEKGGVNLYGFVGNDGINDWDRLGQDKHPDQWLREWLKRNPNAFKGLTPDQVKLFQNRLKDSRDFGCIGLTCIELGLAIVDYPDMSNCYKELKQAEKKQKEMIENKECCEKKKLKNLNGDKSRPRIFSIHFSNNKGKDGINPDAQWADKASGKINMTNWDKKARAQGGTNYDYGYLDGKNMVHANNGVVEHQGPMKVLITPLAQWDANLKPDFNAQVYCVACEKDDLKPR